MAIPGNLLGQTTESIAPNTSGWVAKLNCVLALGSGGRNGDGVLRLTSSAAGEMQVRTVSSYPVIPDVTYYTFADASGATVPERIGIRWLDADGAELSVTWSLTTDAAAVPWHRISVAGPAPMGADRAHVLLSSTPAAAGVISYFENVYLGLPIRTQGNLFSYAVESSEIDASGWETEVNATISRQVPALTWPVDWYWAGGHVIAMTATAGGNASIECVERATVTPGMEYRGHAYLNPPTLAAATWIELRFYDSNGNQIAAERGPLDASGTGWMRQYVSGIAPAAAATCGVAAGIDGASGGQVLRVETVVVTVAPDLRSGSIVPYADASFEQGIAGWTVPSGVATLSRSSPWNAAALNGSYSLTVTSATATTSVIRSAPFPAPSAGGLPWRSELYELVTAESWTITRTIRWLDAGGALISTSSSAPGPVPDGGWWWLSTSATAPAGTEQIELEYTLTAGAVDSVLQIDRVASWQDEPLVSAVAHDDLAYIALTLRDLPDSGLISVWRVGQDGDRTLLRGETGLIAGQPLESDLLLVEDHEAPLGVPVTYYAEIRSATTGELTGTRTSAAVTIDPGDVNYVWLKDPGNPQRNLRVMVERAPDWDRPIEQGEYRIRGRRNTVIHSDVRGGLEGDLAIWTEDDDQRAALHWLLDPGHTLLWQAAPGMGVADLYVNVGAVGEARVTAYAPEPWRAWTLPLVESDMPTTGISGAAGRTWQDVLSTHATWEDVLGRYATWEDVLLDRPIGGG